jgi:hypothetical protein
MSDIKIQLNVKHKTAENPGVWEDSILKLYLKADRHIVKRAEQAIKAALGGQESHER